MSDLEFTKIKNPFSDLITETGIPKGASGDEVVIDHWKTPPTPSFSFKPRSQEVRALGLEREIIFNALAIHRRKPGIINQERTSHLIARAFRLLTDKSFSPL
jgi:hypothetical protein